MSIGAVTLGTKAGDAEFRSIALVKVSMPGDTAYPTGGTLLVGAAIAAALGTAVTILGIIPQDCGGFVPAYLPATDALKVYEQSGVDDTALDEVDATTDLHTTTFNFIAICI